MESPIKTSQTRGTEKPKPALGPKPRLAPKPFSLQKNNIIHSIHAPKTVTAASKQASNHSAKAEGTGVPKETLTPPAQKTPQQTTTPVSKPSSVSVHSKDKSNTTKGSQHREDTVNSSVAPAKSDPALQTNPSKETPKSEPVQKEDVIQTNNKAPEDTVTDPEQKDVKDKEDKPSVIKKPEESGSEISPTAKPTNRLGSKKRLSTELTSKFEAGGQSVPPKPNVIVSTTKTKDNVNKPASSAPERSQTTPEPSNKESDDGELKDYSEGGSIKRRISLLFDSSSRPEVMTKKEEPEILTVSQGVKERIKNWCMETSSEPPKPQLPFRTRSRSFESVTSPTAEKAPKLTPAELTTIGTPSIPAVTPSSEVSQTKQSTEIPVNGSQDAVEKPLGTLTEKQHEQYKSTDVEVQLPNYSSSTAQTATDEGKSASSETPQRPLKRDNVKRRSVHFGIVETDDGGPPLILGSPSDSSSEEEDPEDKGEEKLSVSGPTYRRVGILQEEEKPKHLESEKRLTAEENKLARLKLEEERKKQEEEEKEKENAIRREALRIVEEEKRREEERLRRLKEEEIERQKQEEKERERLKEEENKRKQLEEVERERQMELMRQRQREEERERAKQKEERLKKDEDEREKERLRRLKEEEIERQKQEEKERERLKEEENKRKQLEEIERERQMELMRQRQREEERERAKQKEERLKKDEEEREKERLRRLKEEEIERQKQEEKERERLKEEENKRKQLEEIERERQMELMRQRQREEERLRKLKEEEIERQRQQEKERERLKEEENKRKQLEEIERERQMELMRQRQREEEREKARQREERLRQEEREKERLRKEAEERERERQRRLEEEERMARQRQEEEEGSKRTELERRIKQEQAEEMERLKKIEQRREEVEKQRAKELEEKLRMEKEREKQLTLFNLQQTNLTSLDSEDVPQKSEMLHSPLKNADEPPQSQIEVVYDDFSVRKPQIEVEFDDFSVKPRRWGSQAKVETRPVRTWRAEPEDKEEVEGLVLLDFRPYEHKVPDQVPKPDSPEPTPASESPEEEDEEEVEEEVEERSEEEQLIFIDIQEEKEDSERESDDELYTQEDDTEDEDKEEVQVDSYCINSEDKDTDALIDSEPDQQNGICEHMSETDSPKPISEPVPEVSPQDDDTTDFHREPEFVPFPESPTPLLDTSAQRSKAVLGRRRSRSRPSRSLRLAQTKSPNWRVDDSTDETETFSKHRDSDSEEEQPKSKIVCSPPPTSQRVPTIPGLNPAALIAQLKRRTVGGGAGGGDVTEEVKQREKENQHEEVAQSLSQLSRSPRPAAHLAGAALVLPPIGSPDGGAVSSPAWLKELKTKKRLSQYDSEA